MLTASLDLSDLTATSGGGLHLAAMGSVWQALAWGFAGLSPDGAVLGIAPRLPERWTSLELRLRFHGTCLRIDIAPSRIVVDTDGPVRVRLDGTGIAELAAGTHRLERHGGAR